MSDDETKNVLPEQPVQPIETPEFETPSQPTATQQPVNTSYQSSVVNTEGPKKNKKLAGIIAALVAVAACVCLVVFAGPKIMSAFSNSHKNPEERFKAALTTVADKACDNANSTEAAEEMNQKKIKVDGNFDFTIGEGLSSIIPAEYSSFKNLGGKLEATLVDDNNYVSLALQSANKPLATLNVYLDQISKMAYINIPELSTGYISTKLNDVMSSANVEVEAPSMTPEEAAKFIKDETELLNSHVKDVEEETKVDVTANGIKSTYDKLTVKLDSKEMLDVVYDLCKRLSEEEAIIKTFADKMNGKSSVDFDELLEKIKNADADDQTKMYLSLYLDKDDNIKGCDVKVKDDNSNAIMSFLSATDKETGFEFTVSVDGVKYLEVKGSYTEKDDVYNGSMTCVVTADDDEITLDLGFKDFKATSGKNPSMKGSFTVSCNKLMGATITCDIDAHDKSVAMNLDVSMAGVSFGSLKFDFTYDKADTCPTVPADAILYDAETDMEAYMTTADLMSFVQNLTDVTGIDFMSLLYSAMYQ